MAESISFFPKTLNIRRYNLRETSNFFLLFGSDKTRRKAQVLTILKKEDNQKNYNLKDIIIEDTRTYDNESYKQYMTELNSRFSPVTMKIPTAYGILGFIRFLKGYYIVLITQRKRVAKIGRHSIYTIKDMAVVPLFKQTSKDNRDDENRYLQIFK